MERLLVSLAGTTDEFTFQIGASWPRSGEYSHTVKLIDGAAGAVLDLRLWCCTLGVGGPH